MLGHLYEGGENALWTFILVTVLMGGLAAYASGKAIAQTWRPFWHVPLYMLAVAAAVRFLHFALFEEPLASLTSYTVDFLIALAAASLGYRLARARQMTGQYGWLYRRRGPLGWRGAGHAS
jgi:hypothetical protein